MKNENLTFTFVVNFRGGTYCSQVKAKNVLKSIPEWIKLIEKERGIKFLGDKVIAELKTESDNNDNLPVQLRDLKSIWYTLFQTKQGFFHINIIQTDLR